MTIYPLAGKQIIVKTTIDAYGSSNGQLQPGDTARVVKSKVPAVMGRRPYFTLVEFERNGSTQRAAVWPGDWSYSAEESRF